jgi:GDP-mannose 6-dehydrogenase
MKISVFGLGYVGCVGAACLARQGHRVLGVDVNEQKVRTIRSGRPTIREEAIDGLIADAVRKNALKATQDGVKAAGETDVSLICVGTPSRGDGRLNTDYVLNAANEIGEGIRGHDRFHTVLIRSTVPPGTTEKVVAAISQASGKRRDIEFGVVSNPEFLREGSAVDDYDSPELTVLASASPEALSVARTLYSSVAETVVETDVAVAEILKYVNNAFHALKISFANEVGRIAKACEVDGRVVMKLITQDQKLNISPMYLRPGLAFGGSCLPKDLRGLSALATMCGVEAPLLEGISKSNEAQKRRLERMVSETAEGARVGILGLAFKEGTDDLRESPTVELVAALLDRGREVRVFDKHVSRATALGANQQIFRDSLPQLGEILTDDLEAVISESDVLVVVHRLPQLAALGHLLTKKTVIDGVGNLDPTNDYSGLCW